MAITSSLLVLESKWQKTKNRLKYTAAITSNLPTKTIEIVSFYHLSTNRTSPFLWTQKPSIWISFMSCVRWLPPRWVDLTLLCACWLFFVTLITRSISYNMHGTRPVVDCSDIIQRDKYYNYKSLIIVIPFSLAKWCFPWTRMTVPVSLFMLHILLDRWHKSKHN